MSTPRSETAADARPDVTAIAVGLLATQGYDATTVDQIADAARMSRSTFFRRYGSKDDVVFADHDSLIAGLEAQLRRASGDRLLAVVAAARSVFDHHVQRPDVARDRHELLLGNAALRDRELVTTHRYERLFAKHLRQQPDAPDWAATAFAAGVVAVHNQALRSWLHAPDPAAAERLDADLAHLVATFRPAFAPGGAPARVVVAVYDASAAPADVLAAVRSSIER